MNAIRQIQEVKAGAVTITLPADFLAKRVEIIVLPLEDTTPPPQTLQELLLEAPTLTHQELQAFEQVREWMNRWTVNEF